MISFAVVHGESTYDVLIGSLYEAIDRIAAVGDGRPLPMVTDARVLALHGATLAPVALQPPILIPEGEAAKDWTTLAAITDGLARRNVHRGTPILALGGGSIGDVTGLAASLFKRGCPVIHIPTTLLSQADSAIGGKTAIDAAGQKNLVGTFHMPALVVADPALLDTLDPRQMRSGYAEIVKYGLIDDPAFFAWCEDHGAALIAGDRVARHHAVATCIRAKARFVTADPFDRLGHRALLNLGHSFAHAVEAEAGMGRLLHGEAVAIGLVLAFRLSTRLGLCPEADGLRVAAHLRSVGLPTSLDQVGLARAGDALLNHMRADKKNRSDAFTLILTHSIGRATLAPVPNEALVALLAA
ncbi:MAG: 3-dehydroquinate synthase family protein [Pseudomonadota bacterium]